MVITGVAERIPERLRQLVYLDALVPEDGQSQYDVEGVSEEERAGEWARAETAGTPGFEPPPLDWIRANLPPEANPEWIAARVSPHPLATLAQPRRVQNPAAAALPRAFVLCTEGKTWDDGPVSRFVARVRADPAWRYREVAAEHIGPLTTPAPVAEVLLPLIDG